MLISDIEGHMRLLDDRELRQAVVFNRSGFYTREQLAVAQEELTRRSLPVPPTAEEYWKRYPGERITESGFCVDCVQQTTDESPGSTYLHISLGGFGTALSGDDDLCPACGSVVQSKVVWIIVPVARRGRYRVIYLNQGDWGQPRLGNFVGRRLKT